MEMPDGKQRQPDADLSEAALWYLRSKAKHLPSEERDEFAKWMRHSPENIAAILSIATMDRHGVPRWREAGRVKQLLMLIAMRMLRLRRAESHESTKHRAISHSYFKHLKRKYFWPKLGLLAATLCSVAGWICFEDVRPLKLAAVAFGCLLLLVIREAVVGFRVTKGYFGTTESEVRDFVKFIRTHPEDIDFTDEGGKRRPALVSEPPRPDSATTPASAPTGALSE
jgi:hypothetical protein